MTTTVEKLAETVKALTGHELDEFLSWLADYGLARPDRWNEEIEPRCPAGWTAGCRVAARSPWHCCRKP